VVLFEYFKYNSINAGKFLDMLKNNKRGRVSIVLGVDKSLVFVHGFKHLLVGGVFLESLTFLELAAKVLQEANRPMSGDEIWRYAQEKGMRSFHTKKEIYILY